MLLAHAFGERYELPIPLALFLVAGSAVVVLSFVLVLRRTAPSVDSPVSLVKDTDTVPARPFRLASGVLSIALMVLVAVIGLAGTQETSANLAPLAFWLLGWIVVPMTVGLLGDWTPSVNPFANLARLGDDPRLRKTVLARKQPLEWSAKLGWWPAVGLFVLLVLGELVFNLDATRPAFVGAMLLVYGVLSLFLGLLFGPSWLARGEVFSGLFNAWGRLGFFRFGAPGRRGFAGGLTVPFEPNASRIVFVLLLLVSINFDGLLSTPQWARYERSTVGLDSAWLDAFRTGSLVLLLLVVLGVFTSFALGSAKAGQHRTGPLASLAGLLPSLVPIAYGYLLAHYLEYLVSNGQLLIALIGNPGFEGWPISLPAPFDGSYEVDPTLLPSSFYWYVSVVVIVAAHIVAVVLAHRHLSERASDQALAQRSEYPWLVAMVAYTALSLFLIAQPLTEDSAASAPSASAPAHR